MGLLNKDAKKRLQPICDVDLEKYSGTWFEIARYSHAFEKGMEQVTATTPSMDLWISPLSVPPAANSSN